MLLFELFPAVLALVSIVVAVMLFAANRRARSNQDEEAPRSPSRPAVGSDAAAPEKSSRRPSMRA